MEDKIANKIQAKFHMISGSEDKQTSADVFNVGTFELPNPAGKAGGACTSTLISVLTENQGRPMSWIDLLHKMRAVLLQKGFDQVPQLSSSEMLDVNDRFFIVSPETQQHNGARRAIMIGINYTGQKGQLSGCHNDVKNTMKYLIQKEGFQEKDMVGDDAVVDIVYVCARAATTTTTERSVECAT
jgi:metacaspase-1